MTYLTVFPRTELSMRSIVAKGTMPLTKSKRHLIFKKSAGVAFLSLQKAIVNYLWHRTGPKLLGDYHLAGRMSEEVWADRLLNPFLPSLVCCGRGGGVLSSSGRLGTILILIRAGFSWGLTWVHSWKLNRKVMLKFIQAQLKIDMQVSAQWKYSFFSDHSWPTLKWQNWHHICRRSEGVASSSKISTHPPVIPPLQLNSSGSLRRLCCF